MVACQDIRGLSDGIAKEYRPERIVLFGYYAGGTPRDGSDVDVLVVMGHDGYALRKAAEIVQRFDTPFAVDLIIHTPEELRRRLAWNDRSLRGILDTGQVLFAAADH